MSSWRLYYFSFKFSENPFLFFKAKERESYGALTNVILKLDKEFKKYMIRFAA